MALKDFEDEPSAQLLAELLASIPSANLRPLLTHLNADTSWLLSIPYPAEFDTPKHHSYYHILIDPWFTGPQSDVAAFFSQQWHAIPSAVQSARELEERIRRIEESALGGDDCASTNGSVNGGGASMNGAPGADNESYIDAIIISHEFTDHMHKETLLSLSASIPVIASSKAARIIASWKHFSSVSELPRFSGNWKEHSNANIPHWVSITRIAYPGVDLLYYHAAVMICFPSTNAIEAEAILYTPHGVSPDNVKPVAIAEPKIRTLALLHGLQDIKLLAGAQLNLGAHNGLKVQRLLGCKYWVGTHDEIKRGGGIVSWFLNRKVITLKEAVEMEKTEKGEDMEGSELEGLSDVRFEEVDNGGSLVLE